MGERGEGWRTDAQGGLCWALGTPKDFFLGIQLLYNVVLVSAVQQCESAICIHISLPA